MKKIILINLIIFFDLKYIISNGTVINNINNPFVLKQTILKTVIIMNNILIMITCISHSPYHQHT